MLKLTFFTGGILLMALCSCKESQITSDLDQHKKNEPSNFSRWERSFKPVTEDSFYIVSSWETEDNA